MIVNQDEEEVEEEEDGVPVPTKALKQKVQNSKSKTKSSKSSTRSKKSDQTTPKKTNQPARLSDETRISESSTKHPGKENQLLSLREDTKTRSGKQRSPEPKRNTPEARGTARYYSSPIQTFYTPSALNVKGLQAINEKLQTALDAARMEAEVARRCSGHSKICETEEERSWHLRILKNIKLNLWPIEVFINKDKKLIRATTLIMLEMNPPEVAAYRDEGDRKVAQAKWVNDNTEVVRKT